MISQSKELPPAITTDLDVCLAAGVGLDPVRTTMFGSGSVAGEALPQLTEGVKGEEPVKQEQTKQEQIKQEQIKGEN